MLHSPPETGSASAVDAPPPTLDELRAGSGSGGGAAVAPLWFERAASHFAEALPLGNGRLGAMVYGGAWRERVLLNEEGVVGYIYTWRVRWAACGLDDPAPSRNPHPQQAQHQAPPSSPGGRHTA